MAFFRNFFIKKLWLLAPILTACGSGGPAFSSANWNVTTIAGGRQGGYSDGTGSAALFSSVTGITTDSSGNLYLTDAGNNLVRKIDSQSNVSTYAGTTTGGYQDGMAATAEFSTPNGLVLDSQNNLYVNDTLNRRIRKITSSGIVTTLAGAGEDGYLDGQGTTAEIDLPQSIAIDPSGILYVADGTHRIRAITLTGAVSTWAGNGSTSLFQKAFLAVNPAGEVFLSDPIADLVRLASPSRVSPPTGSTSRLAGSGSPGRNDGSATTAQFKTPEGLAFGPDGTAYVADFGNRLIRSISPLGVVTTIAGSGVTGLQDGAGPTAQFLGPTSIAVDGSGTVYVGDYTAVRKLTQ